MLTRDAGVADRDAMAEGEMDDVYKPRVTTWGMFPRPADISKAVSIEQTCLLRCRCVSRCISCGSQTL